MSQNRNSILILGTRGVPANHGGFETFAEHLALFLVDREDGTSASIVRRTSRTSIRARPGRDSGGGVKRIIVQTAYKGGIGTLDFELAAAWFDAVGPSRRLPFARLQLARCFLPYSTPSRPQDPHQHGRDRMEAGPKWSPPVRAWMYVNEWIGGLDLEPPGRRPSRHRQSPRNSPAALRHRRHSLWRRDPIERALRGANRQARPGTKRKYLVSIARIEPDNNIHTIVEAFSQRRKRGMKLVGVGQAGRRQRLPSDA